VLPHLVSWLPRGSYLAPEEWQRRHRWVLLILASHGPGLLILALLTQPHEPGHVALALAVPVVGTALAAVPVLGRRTRSAVAAAAVMACSCAVMLLANGAGPAHLHYFLMIPVIAVYEQWLPFAVGVACVLVNYGVIGTWRPRSVYADPADIANPWGAAAIHTALFAVGCVGSLMNWHLHEVSRAQDASATAKLRHGARHDNLTGLPNREWLLEEAPLRAGLVRGVDAVIAVLVIDVEQLTTVNKTLGFDLGDRLLVQIAERLDAAVGAGERAVRLPGDNFAVVLTGDRAARAEEVAQELRHRLSDERISLGGVDIAVEISIGIASDDGMPGEAGIGLRDRLGRLLRCADVALGAGRRDKVRIAVYDPKEDQNTIERLALLTDLREALFTDQLKLAFQPKVSLVDGAVPGVEALLRWTHPVRGAVPPMDVVPAAEATNLVTPLTYRVLTIALLQAGAWRDSGAPLRVSVNVPPRCLIENDFVESVSQALESTGVPPGLLCLELTETSLMAHPERTLGVVRRLRDLGVELSLDDFGTGFSSLNYLRRLPVTELKIDKTFVRGLFLHSQDAILVESTIALAHRLGMTVVAEGVEDERTASVLTALGCDLAQGYLYARPLRPGDVLTWVLDRRRQTSAARPG
jgi:diguanylate cyclase (GGDEF)-like protein